MRFGLVCSFGGGWVWSGCGVAGCFGECSAQAPLAQGWLSTGAHSVLECPAQGGTSELIRHTSDVPLGCIYLVAEVMQIGAPGEPQTIFRFKLCILALNRLLKIDVRRQNCSSK